MKRYTIKDVAEKTGLTAYTLRYYEKCGLLKNIERDENGNRRFSEDDIVGLEIIKCLKETGMSIKDIKNIVDLTYQGEKTIDERKKILLEHKEVVLNNIKKLEENLKKIELKIKWYNGECKNCK